jgi:hypothetical protein
MDRYDPPSGQEQNPAPANLIHLIKSNSVFEYVNVFLTHFLNI